MYGRRRRRRSSAPRSIIQSFKKVINHPGTSNIAAATVVYQWANGVDSIAAGQTTGIDVNVPTGCIIKNVAIQWTGVNLTGGSNFFNCSIQFRLGGQTAFVSPIAIGGNNQRNQSLKQCSKSMGPNQSVNYSINFKIPPRFQRIREGTTWAFVTTASANWSSQCQFIYKFYR